GFDRLAIECPPAQFIDGGFVQADHRAQRAADQVELVLDDQIGRADRCDVLDLDRRQAFPGLMIAGAVRLVPEQAMALAFLTYATEQRSHLTAPRPYGALVHWGHHHRWRAVVDLLVHGEQPDAGMWQIARPAARKCATALFVTAVNHG